ncbi:hypothetical protein GCM10011413_16930 [Pedobacter psychrotolerans]|uniref:Uncharacterized protein n=1 Tax=Pedobacter psychrotolerans TaxID=1843235 RepID=A0ABQ1SS21_9SPHI|nr:hypothetical protein GCM10011413_16930 [Pedobacter psychrotolerans]
MLSDNKSVKQINFINICLVKANTLTAKNVKFKCKDKTQNMAMCISEDYAVSAVLKIIIFVLLA